MAAYAVVGPTKRKPYPRSAFASASDSGVRAWRSPSRRGAFRRARGANVQTSAASEPSACWTASVAPALAIAASILPRCRTIDASSRRRATSRAAEPGNGARLEVTEGPSERVALAEDRQPRETRLEALEAELLVDPGVVEHGPTPLRVVVLGVLRGRGTPRAATHTVRAADQLGHGPPYSRAMLANFVKVSRNASREIPVGPFLCFDTITSAVPRCSDSGL